MDLILEVLQLYLEVTSFQSIVAQVPTDISSMDRPSMTASFASKENTVPLLVSKHTLMYVILATGVTREPLRQPQPPL